MSENTVLCRICLASNVRMYPIAGTSLQLVYERITNTIMNVTDAKPVTACYICSAYLNKCYKLMCNATKAEHKLATNPVVLKKMVGNLARTANNMYALKTTPVEYFDISTIEDPVMVKDQTTVGESALVKEDPEYVNIEDIEMKCQDLEMFENAEVCSICLAVNVHMSIIISKLQVIYKIITGNLLHTRPVSACYLCYAHLRKCHRLMLKALYADKWMTDMLKNDSKLTQKLVATVDRNFNQLRSSLVNTPVEHYDSHSLTDAPAGGGSQEEYEVTVKIEVEPDVYVGYPSADMLSDTEYSERQSDVEGGVAKSTVAVKCRKRSRKQRIAARNVDEMDTSEGGLSTYKRKSARRVAACRIEKTETSEGGVSTDKRKSTRRVAACTIDKTETSEGGVSTNQPKRPRRKITKRAEKINDDPESQEKKEKPRRVYKKRIRAYTHECSFCKRLFNRTSHLKDHMKTHTDERPFECSICQRRFIQKVNLKNHMMTHTGEKPFECDICHTGFIAKSDLTRHLNTHKEERLFECSMCQRRFTQMSYLKAHVSTHTSEKPHECHICHRRFSQKPYLKNHLKRHLDGDRVELKR